MGSGKTVHDMSLLGGHPVLDFINTVDCRRDSWGPDFLLRYDDLLVWARRTGQIESATARRLAAIADDAPLEAAAALVRARNLREVLYNLCMAETGRFVPQPDNLLAFTAAVLKAMTNRRLSATARGIEWSWLPDDGLDLITERVALSASELLVGSAGKRRLVRECPGRNCGWLFLDTSRGGQRRWCSDKICGTSTRVRNFRAS